MGKDKMKLTDSAVCSIERGRKPNDEFALKGTYKIEIWRKGKLHQTIEGKNTIVNVGKNKILDVMFNSATQLTNQHIGLLGGTGTISASDTMASHSGWTEITDYDESTRGAWVTGSASGQAVTNATPQTYTMNATSTVKGIFICMHSTSASGTKGGTTGTLWAAALFGTAAALEDNDLLRVYYTVTC